MTIIQWLFPFRRIEKRAGKFTELKPELILKTIQQLEHRILERFPDSGLYKVCTEFHELARESEKLAIQLGKPVWWLRIMAWLLGFLLLGLSAWAFWQMTQHFSLHAGTIHDLLQGSESAINELIFLCLALYFFVNIETRLKRRTAMQAIHRLRSIAHVVDMHQLTKDPAWILNKFKDTASSPERLLDRKQLNRYLDYCSEILALNTKVAALFAQNMEDEVVVGSVNDLELLVQGLSGKIWQKIMILDLAEED